MGSPGFPGGSVVKNLPAVQEPQEMRVQSLDREDPLEEDRGAWWAAVHGVSKS